MTEAALEKDQTFLSQLVRLGTSKPGPPWLDDSRQGALSRVQAEGLPTGRDEAWRNTDLSPLTTMALHRAQKTTNGVRASDLPLAELSESRLVFVNGHYRSELSSVGDLPPAVNAKPLSEALNNGSEALKKLFSVEGVSEGAVFEALNLALFDDGAVVEIPAGTTVEQPIHLLFVSAPEADACLVSPRVLLLAGANSQATVIESHVGFTENTYFSNAVTELVVAENAVVDYYKLQKEGPGGYHVGSVESRQERSSNVRTSILTLGARLVRNESRALLAGEGGYVELNGLYLGEQDHHVDNYTSIEHLEPHCSSREVYKGILNDNASGVFRGRIVVAEGAQQTDSKQSNDNLLLSDDATVNTKPQLEIYADDVKCTHGATIGQVEDEAMFYLRSRGLDEQAARSILIYAFARAVAGEIRPTVLREQLDGFLFDWLPGAALLKN